MSGRINLVLLGDSQRDASWPIGVVRRCKPTPSALSASIICDPSQRPDGWLFWNSADPLPTPAEIQRLLATPVDVWHAGLRLGMAGLPGIIDYVRPMWMLNRDPNPDVEATSWRLSLEACVIRDSVLEQLGFIACGFEGLDAAGLELGHRYINSGAIMRHRPQLVHGNRNRPPAHISLVDEFLFARYRFAPKWLQWALMRMIVSRSAGLGEALKAWNLTHRKPVPPQPQPLSRDLPGRALPTGPLTVSVIVPTIDRYPYLKTLLDQLRRQTLAPHQVIVVDQTIEARRDLGIAGEYSDLPLAVIYQDEPGQCTSRNRAVQESTGAYLLFVDDDDEIPETLIEDHLRNMAQFQANVSCGVAEEVGALSLPETFRHSRVSDVFPTGNSLLHRDALTRSGLFDLAYNRGQRADGDLGMRLYKSGALMVLQPSISVLHHHAPSGGLRAHKARTITYASSRQRLAHRRIRSATEIYLGHRYFSRRQLRESLWVNVLGTFSIRGNILRKCLKFLLSSACLPYTIWALNRQRRQASRMLHEFPQIPRLDGSPAHLDL